MKKLLVLYFLVLTLTACGEDSKIKEAVKNGLADPNSAQFKSPLVSTDGKRSCVIWNAKNSTGGYDDWKTAELKKGAVGWVIEHMDGNEDNCSESGFKAIDVGKRVFADTWTQAIKILEKSKNISGDKAYELISTGVCSSVASEFTYNARMSAEYRVNKMKERADSYDEKSQAAKLKLEKGECDSAQ